MPTEYNLLMLGILPWHFSDLSDTVRSMIKAHPTGKIIYINPQPKNRSLTTKWDESLSENVKIWDPPFSLLPTRYKIHRLREKLSAFSLPKYTEKMLGKDWKESTVVYVTPTTLEQSYEYVRFLNPEHLIFDILDDNLNFPSITEAKRKRLTEMYIYIANRATVITAVSEYLIKQTKELTGREDIHYLPNGVNVEMFKTVPRDIPNDIKHIPHPRVTFVGAITSWIDLPLIEGVARKLRDIHFVFVGPIDQGAIDKQQLQKLFDLDNIHFLGGKPYSEVPKYLHASDVLLLPRTMDPYSLACDPLKLYEYLATGKPVVSTSHPSIKRFSEFVYSGATIDEIVEGIQKSLNRSEESARMQQSIIDRLSWETRIQKLLSLLNKSKKEYC
jgi:glycosyltransferase involved in cell wall biosynthesis